MSDAVSRAVAGSLPAPSRRNQATAPAGPGVAPPGPPGPSRPGQPLPPGAVPGPALPGVAAPASPKTVRGTSVRIDGVNKVYPNGKAALIEIDLVIPEGDFIFLVGPSGAGKSTLIKLLVRDEQATDGSVQVAGYDLGKIRKNEVPLLRRKIGIVFQDFRLLPRKTVYENVAFALEVTGTDKSLVDPAVESALALVGLTAQSEQRPDQLSGGEMQMIAISRALLGSPGLVLFDEPSQGLAPKIVQDVMQTISRLKGEGISVLIVEQNAHSALAVSDRVYIMDLGKIVHSGPTSELLEDNALRTRLLGI